MPISDFNEYRDLNITFEPHPITGDLIIAKGNVAVTQSISSLLSTFVGERILDKQMGSDLRNFLFENPSISVAGDIRDEITRVIREYEPRVTQLDIDVQISENFSSYDVEVKFSTNNIVSNQDLSNDDLESLRFSLNI